MNQSIRSPSDRIIMISGANRGIGRAITERLYAEGYILSLGVRSLDKLRSVVDTMHPERFLAHRYEATDPQSAHDWVVATIGRFGRIDGLINNAGIVHPFSLEEADETHLDKMWEVNLKGPLRLIRSAFPYLKKTGSGRVINIVSLSGKRVKSAKIGGYAITKHAMLALTHATRYSGWEYGIRCTAICPGFVATDMSNRIAKIPPEEMTQPESVAHLVAMLLNLPNTASVAEVPINCVLESTI